MLADVNKSVLAVIKEALLDVKLSTCKIDIGLWGQYSQLWII